MLSLIWVKSDGSELQNWKLFKGSRARVLSRAIVIQSLGRYTLRFFFFFWIPPWWLKWESTSPAIAYACWGNYSYILNVECLYWTMPSQCAHTDTTPVIRIGQKQQKCRCLGNSQSPLAKWRVSIPAGERVPSPGGSSVASTIPGQNSTLSSSLNNFAVVDINHLESSTQSTTQPQSMMTPTFMPGTGSRSTPAPGGTSQTAWTGRVVSSLTSSIASTPHPLSGLDNLLTSIPHREAHTTITKPLGTWATDRNRW